MLISAMLGIDSRTTMDIDTTIKGFELNKENISNIMEEICSINLKDNVTLKITKVEEIRDDDEYGGYRITFISKYNDEMPVTLKVDVTTGDKITHKEIKYKFELMLEDKSIDIWSYNVETILAEKFETVIKRGVLSTRVRDYYDIYMLLKSQKKNINEKTLYDAIIYTTLHRESKEIIAEWKKVIDILSNDDIMRRQWKKYQKDNFYAQGIEYDDLISGIEEIGIIFNRYNIKK